MKWFLLRTLLIALTACAASPSGLQEDPCPWTTSTGRKSCGARPPAHRVDPQHVARWLVKLDEPMRAMTDGTGVERTLVWSSLAPIDLRDHMIQLSLEASGLARAAKLELVLGSDGFADHFLFGLHSPQGQQWITDEALTALSISWSPSSIAGTPDRSRITDIMVRMVDDASGTPIAVSVAGIALVPEPVARYPRGVLSFTFDDNHATMISEAAPVLDAKGFAATAYLIIDQLDLLERATFAQIQERHARGWDIAAHSYSSFAHNERWPTLPATVVEDGIVDARAWLMANGFTGFDHCAYPGGDFTLGGATDVLAIVERYFTSCRTIYQRQREAVPPADARKLRVLYVTRSTTLEAAKHAIDNAMAAREWIILVFHRLVDDAKLTTEWRKTDFAALVDHVASTGIPVEPVAKVLGE